MADADLYNLEFLSLVAKITQEINNYTGLNDKTLAEFVISLHDQSKTLPEFKAKLQEVGANFPESFIENVDRLILTLHPKHKKKPAATGKENDSDGVLDEIDKKKRLFPGLALKDKEWEPTPPKDAIMQEVDDMMSQLEGASKRARPRAADEERSPKRLRRSRSRSHSPPPPPRRRSPSPSRGRGYDDRRDDRRGRGGGRQLDERPVLFKIYNGRVNGLKEFGAFIQLEGVAGRVEGEFCFVMCELSMLIAAKVWCTSPTSSKEHARTQLLTY